MNHRVFIDTNIILDLLGKREPFYDGAAKLASLADKGLIQLYISSLSFPTVYYILSKVESSETVKLKLHKLKVITTTVDLTDGMIDKALLSSFKDFEDALQYYSALQSDCHILITRNVKDFKSATISLMTPNEYLKLFDRR